MKKKGFTLIELLAVIVILAVIALIATPIILNVIEKAKKGAAESSALGYIDAVEKSVGIGTIDSTKGIIVPSDNDLSLENEDDIDILEKILVKGTKPDYVSLQFKKGKIISGSFCINNYSFDYDGKEIKDTKSNYCTGINVKDVKILNTETVIKKGIPFILNVAINSLDNNYTVTFSSSDESVATISTDGTVTPIKSGKVTLKVKADYKVITKTFDVLVGPTKVEAASDETHKGIVYLDPTNIDNYCSKTEADKNVNKNGTPTEIKTGCMKWYVYKDDNNIYTMILDHNTVSRIVWNNSNRNVAYTSSNLYPVVQSLITTNGWQVTTGKISKIRLITASEVNTLTGKTGFNANDTQAWYLFDTKTQASPNFTNSYSNFYWLYDYTNSCEGCKVADNNLYNGLSGAGNGATSGYWIDAVVGTAGSGTNVWRLFRSGGMYSFASNDVYNGIRPVIEIPQNLIKNHS